MSTYETPCQKVSILDFSAQGLILDVGGGGEGVIGRLKGRQVVAIDKQHSELDETENAALKIVMDATDMRFVGSPFVAATSFFTLMYIDAARKLRAIREIFRVLQPHGALYIWDARIDEPALRGRGHEVFIVHLDVGMPGGETVRTGYGVQVADHGQDSDSIVSLSTAAGFVEENLVVEEYLFFLKLRKPASSPC